MLSVSAHPPQPARPAGPASFGTSRVFVKGEAVFGQGDPARQLFQVLSGTIRTSQLLCDGRRQIDGFHLPGDVFGLEPAATHRFGAEAIDTATVLAFPRQALGAGVQGAGPERDLLAVALRALERSRAHLLALGRKNATEKVAGFLLDLSERLCDARCIDLPMSRTDIADYLGLTIETVSRTLCQLERDGIIALPDRRCVVLRDRARLRRLDA